MLTFFKRHVSARLALIWLVVAVPLSIVLLVTYYAWYQSRVSLAVQERQGYAQSTGASFELLLTEMRLVMRSSGGDVADASVSPTERQAELQRLVVSNPVAYAAFADAHGRILYSSRPGLVGESVAADSAFKSAMRAPDGGGLEPSEVASGGLVGFHVAQSIPARPGRTQGVMLMFVDVNRLHRAFPVSVAFGGISVIDSAGQVVFQNEDVRFAESRANWGERFPFVRRALGGKVTATAAFAFPGDGIRLGVFVPITPIGWAAGSSVGPGPALAPFYRTLAVGLPLAVLVGVLALGVAIVISRRIHRSLDELASAAVRIGSGSLDEPVQLRRTDEIGQVAQSLEAARVELHEARERIERELATTAVLLHASQVLAERLELAEVLKKLAEVLLTATSHTRSFVFFWDPKRRVLTRAASAGVKPFPEGTVFPFDSVSASTRTAILEKRTVVQDFDAMPAPQRGRALAEEESHIAAVVPLIWRGDLVGLIGVDDPGERREFTDREIDIIEGIAAQAAVAIENARLFDAQARGRELADRLDEVNRIIHSSLDFGQTMQRALEMAGRTLGAGAGAVFLDVEGVSYARYQYGFPAGFEGTPYAGEMFPFAKALVQTKEPVGIGEDRLDDLMDADIAREFGVRSLLAMPLVGRNEVIGGIGLIFREPHEFAPAEVDFSRKLAASVSLAIENARLFEAERERARFGRSMVEINAGLASSLDIDDTLPVVLHKARNVLGAYGAIVLDRAEGGWTVREAEGVRSPAFAVGALLTDKQTPLLTHLPEARQPQVVADVAGIPGANVKGAAEGGFRAYASFPLVVRGQLTGTLSFLFEEPRSLSEHELDYLRRVAFAVSLAEENSRLYESEHRIAETLQTALLALPDRIPGIEFAHLYHSATEAARVGGDFYDLFELEHRMVGITVGDISGHGVEAAVLTSLVKNAIRVQATQQDKTPDRVMATANQLLYDNSPGEIFATVFFGVLHLDTGLLEYCNAGHTTGACICAGGGTRKLLGNSTLIGAFTDREFALSTEHVAVGEMLFLYTDGLTEARRDSELFGEKRLFELLDRERGGDSEGTLHRVVDEVLSFAGGRLRDDLAILVVRRGESGGERTD